MKSTLVLLIIFLTSNKTLCLEYSDIVELPSGKVRGAVEYWRGRSAYEYKGIPYASPPIGSRRYTKPVESQLWEGVRDTISYGKSCPQLAPATIVENQDEDCLYLNVYVNKETFDDRHKQLKPVLFWIHGGGFMNGSGNEHDAYKGIPLVIVEDVVLVTCNYRLGPFGFLDARGVIPSIVPNLGLWDQNFALKWVHENIHLFGGDPNKVTIFGQSAGSSSVTCQILSPESNGLFSGAIMESAGVIRSSLPEENRIEIIESFMDSLNCSNVTDKLACLRAIPWPEILNNRPSMFLTPAFGDEFLPLEPEEAIANHKFNDVNLLAGAERDEGDALICSTYKFANLKATNSSTSTYGYIHTQSPLRDFNDIPMCGKDVDKVCHCDELPFVFGAPLREPQFYDADDIELSVNIMKIWADFARSGKPTRQGPINWPSLHEKASNILSLIELNNKFLGKIDLTTGTKCLN